MGPAPSPPYSFGHASVSHPLSASFRWNSRAPRPSSLGDSSRSLYAALPHPVGSSARFPKLLAPYWAGVALPYGVIALIAWRQAALLGLPFSDQFGHGVTIS